MSTDSGTPADVTSTGTVPLGDGPVGDVAGSNGRIVGNGAGTQGSWPNAIDESLPTVLAAGVICWRRAGERLQVLMVHRPRYDDWSFPKGKLEPGELLPQCAVRELAEETGVLARLGRPLPSVVYAERRGARKEVSYWAGQPLAGVAASAPVTEIDQIEWVDLARAEQRLTAEGDRAPLRALADLAAHGGLETTPVLVMRHATARPRDSWARADADRPLVGSGRRQAAALADLLRCWAPEHIVSSPWRRCLETIAPYVKAGGVRVRTKGGLSERGFRRDPGKSRKHTDALLDRARAGALCTHRPVLAGVFHALRARASRDLQSEIPDTEPFLQPGEVLVAHVHHAHSRRPRVVAIERHIAPR